MSSRRIGSYQITDYVGSGGFGSVFKAEDVNTPGRIVAIKELHKKHTRNQVIKQRFFQEAVAMARLDHPNLPRLYTFGEDNGSYYLVMEFISGRLLSDEIHESGPMRADRAVNVLTQALDAVSYAHRNGIIHRDLKPDNIILVGDNASLRIKVLDFGIARMVGGESLTLTGEGFGTPSYMSPERMTGAAGDDPRMDLYALGIILFEMLTGQAPFQSKASDPALYWVEMRDLHQREPLPSLAPLGVPGDVERIAMRATAKRLEDRYQSADEMLHDLRSLSHASAADAPTVVLSSSQLLVRTMPGGAEVYVDDLLRGTSDSIRGNLLIDGLTPGLHSVRVLKEGFNEYRINVALEEGRQTDLQVAIPARATVAMPPAENTAAGGLDTLKFQGADEIKTAVLVVESLPAGSTLMSLPLSQATVGVVAAASPEQSRTGKQLAAAAVVILLLALAAAAYFVLRGPGRTPGDSATAEVTTPAPPPASSSVEAPVTQPDGQQPADQDTNKTGQDRRQTEQNAAVLEANKKATETASKSETKEPTTQQPVTSVTTVPAAPAIQPPGSVSPPAAPSRDGCVLITVQDADGALVPGARVGLMNESTGGRFTGRTGPKGHWRQCGLTPGHSVRVAILGPLGGVVTSQAAVVTSPGTFVTLRLAKRMDEAPQRVPNRQRPFRRRP